MPEMESSQIKTYSIKKPSPDALLNSLSADLPLPPPTNDGPCKPYSLGAIEDLSSSDLAMEGTLRRNGLVPGNSLQMFAHNIG